MGGDEHGDALLDQPVDMGPEFAPGDRIDARGRFVEEQGARFVHDGAGERQALLQAERQILGGLAGMAAEIEDIGHQLDAFAPALPAKAIDAGEEFEVLRDRQIAIKREFLRHVAELVAGFGGIAAKIETGDATFAAGWFQQAAEHLEGGGFASAVRAEQAEDLAAANIKADIVGSGEIAEAFGEAPSLNHRSVTLGLERLLRLGEPGAAAGAAAQHIDEGILEARRGRGKRCAIAGLADVRFLVPGHNESDGFALDDAVDDAVGLQQFGKHPPAASRDTGDPEDPVVDAVGHLPRFS